MIIIIVIVIVIIILMIIAEWPKIWCARAGTHTIARALHAHGRARTHARTITQTNPRARRRAGNHTHRTGKHGRKHNTPPLPPPHTPRRDAHTQTRANTYFWIAGGVGAMNAILMLLQASLLSGYIYIYIYIYIHTYIYIFLP